MYFLRVLFLFSLFFFVQSFQIAAQKANNLLSEVYLNGEIQNEYIYEDGQAIEIWQRRNKDDSGLYYHFDLSYNEKGLLDTVVLKDDSLNLVISRSVYNYDDEGKRKLVVWINEGQEGYQVDTIYHSIRHYIDRKEQYIIEIDSRFVQSSEEKTKVNYIEKKCSFDEASKTLECSTFDDSIFPKLSIYKFDDKNRNPILLSIHNQALFPLNFIPHNLKTIKRNPEGSFSNSTFFQYRYNENGLPTLMRYKDENGNKMKFEFEYQ